MTAAMLALLPPALAGCLLARWAWPARELVSWVVLLRLALGVGLGLGLSSLTFFGWAVVAGPRKPGLLVLESLVFGGLALVLLYAGRAGGVSPLFSAANRGLTPPARLAFLFVLACAASVCGWHFAHEPHGDWDASAIWNLRARFLYRGGDRWTDAFSPLIPWTHPDYPLLVPASVARGWTCAGEETTLVPRLTAGLFLSATTALLMAALALLRGPTQGWLGGLALLATPSFLAQGTAQYADVPLAFYFLAGAVLFETLDRGAAPAERLAGLAGLVVALAAWTKNEGLLLLVATAAVRGLGALRRRRGWKPLAVEAAACAAGALPVLAVLAYFKLRLAPTNDLVAGQGIAVTLARLADLGRYTWTAGAFLEQILMIGPGAVIVLAVYARLLGRAPPPARWTGHSRTLLAAMLAGYFVVYLTTPNDLPTHLGTSLDRVLVQLWPLALFAFFLAVAMPAETTPKAAAVRA